MACPGSGHYAWIRSVSITARYPALSDTNLRSEKQFSNEVRRETTHVGLVPVNAGWYENAVYVVTTWGTVSFAQNGAFEE